MTSFVNLLVGANVNGLGSGGGGGGGVYKKTAYQVYIYFFPIHTYK